MNIYALVFVNVEDPKRIFLWCEHAASMDEALLRAQGSFEQLKVDPSKLALVIQKTFEPRTPQKAETKQELKPDRKAASRKVADIIFRQINNNSLEDYEKWKERGGQNESPQKETRKKAAPRKDSPRKKKSTGGRAGSTGRKNS